MTELWRTDPRFEGHDYHSLNAMLNLYDEDGKIQFGADKRAAREYFLQHVNQNTVWFGDLEEKLEYLFEHSYYEREVWDAYSFDFVKSLYKQAYDKRFRFETFLGAFKYYTSYTLKTFDGKRYLERFEDRVVACALYLARGDEAAALNLVDEMLAGRFQPATPTFLNAGKAQRGELVSCFPAGTLIATRDGDKPIESVAVGDEVLTHEGRYRAVERTEQTGTSVEMVTIHTTTGAVLTGTSNHPVLVAPVTGPREWTPLASVRPGDEVIARADGYEGMATVSFVAHDVLPEPVPVYNLRVAEDHSYVANGVVVHNCFLLRMEDNMESISRSINAALQLSKRGGGVAFSLTNLREQGAPIKQIENQASGVVPVMKLFEDSFSYANQLGARQGAGAVYLNAHHPDISRFLDTKRENADEKIRIKTLSLGVVIPDITFELARSNEPMYLFSPYDVEKVYGVPFSDVSVTEKYREMVDDERIRKTRINAREFFQTLAEIQFESGYPYIMFEDTVNKANPIAGRVVQSNLCSEILQISTPSTYDASLGYESVGRDISCNLGSLNIALAMDGRDIARSVEVATRALTAVSDLSDISSVPSIAEGNRRSHAIGLGQMNLHGFLAREHIHYDSPEALDFVRSYFATVNFHSIYASWALARERGETFDGFEESAYAPQRDAFVTVRVNDVAQEVGAYFEPYVNESFKPRTDTVKALLRKFGFKVPSVRQWAELAAVVAQDGLYNAYRLAVPPTGSISYINNSTSSIHPIVAPVEIRKEGKLGRVYYPAPFMSNENVKFYRDAYEIGADAVIDVYAEATKHTDQGLSLTLFFKDTATTRDVNRAQISAWKKGVKTVYYIRLRQAALEGTEVEGCVSCTL